MSTYYEFYIGRKTDDKIEAMGPYVKKNGEFKLIPILERSRSFIYWDEFGAWPLYLEKMTEEQREFFSSDSWPGEERVSLAYWIPYDDVCRMADRGFIQGYVTLDELDMLAKHGFETDSFWDVDVRSPEVVAEMDSETRKNYGHVAYIDKTSTGYICRQLAEYVDPYDYDVDEKDLCFIVRIC